MCYNINNLFIERFVIVMNFKNYVQVVLNKEKADLLVKNGKIVNTTSHRILEDKDLLIYDGKIMGIGNFDIHQAREVIDAKGKYIVPGLIESHVHVESSLLSPYEFAKVLIAQGVTTIINDPHEIGNVLGMEGIKFINESLSQTPLQVYTMFPSCVPATPLETTGYHLTSNDEEILFKENNIYGLAEVMNVEALKNGDDELYRKIQLAIDNGDHIDGHAAGIKGNELNIYPLCHIMNDHEATTVQEAQERLDLGMYLMIREGTIAKNLDELSNVINNENSRRIIVVTDDKHADDLYNEGSVNYSLQRLIHKGFDPITCIQMATINPSECFKLKKGAFIPGYDADFFICNHIDDLQPEMVYIKGKCVYKEREIQWQTEKINLEENIIQKSEIQLPTNIDLSLPITKEQPVVINLIPNRLETKISYETVDLENGMFIPNVKKDLLKIVVVERHHQTGNIGKGIIKGFHIKDGAIATSVAHDSHNIVCVGCNDQDMLCAIRRIEELNGGIVVVKDGNVLEELPLPIAGLMSDKSVEEIVNSLESLKKAVLKIGASPEFNPFLSLSFLTLPVIPEIKITDKGVFLFESLDKHIEL